MFATADKAVLRFGEIFLTVEFLFVFGPGKLLVTIEAGEGDIGHVITQN